MRRSGTSSRKTVKTRHRKTTKAKLSSAPVLERRDHSSVVDLQQKLERQTRELQESLAREEATSEVLRVISSSPRDPKPVFEAILENATRICEAKFGALFLCEGDGLRAVALDNAPRAFAQAMSSIFNPPPFTAIARAANTKQPAQIADITATPGYLAGHPLPSVYRLAGVLAAKVARGVDPASLPIERPTKFETVLNMRTAQALGISIPTSLLLRADEVIE